MRQRELDEAMELLHFAFRRVIEEPDAVLAEHGFGRLHHRVLYVIGRNPGLTMRELLALLGVTKQALHAPMRELVDGELVRVEREASDRRVKRLRLSPAGRRFERRLSRYEHRAFEAAFRDAGPRAVAGWRRVMDALGQRRRLDVERIRADADDPPASSS
ncbi:MAG: MarR family transcriptional regulator [Myxococcota bacterium]